MKNLVGKILFVHFDHKRRNQPCGFHGTQIRSVNTAKRTGEIKTIVVSTFSATSGKYDGKRVKVYPNEWTGGVCGVLWFGKIRPLEELLNGKHE